MQANRRRVFTRRKPLSDCTNPHSSPSSVPLKTSKSKPSSSSSAINKPLTKCTSATANLGNAPNPSSPSPPNLSTPSVKTSPPFGIVDVKASPPNSGSKKRRKDKGKEVAVPMVHHVTVAYVFVVINRETSDAFERENLPKAKALTVSCAKKQRIMSLSSEDVFKDPQLQDFIENQIDFEMLMELGVESSDEEEEVESGDEEEVESSDELLQDFIEKQKSYFKMIDEFELSEEEVESSDELD
ncbi:microtubule-associated protein RP/EB family member 1-like [Abrus precatorius]|uniref:Microtubule-associated protein RP/EB family member 1-like n=1 Tax=Abrus precatorius TaxID=3816 RepID=A0A8B8MMS8_ABRPR|nr:microtubule-associated protein RP/EB family member 1-like [Abrus precatorius]